MVMIAEEKKLKKTQSLDQFFVELCKEK